MIGKHRREWSGLAIGPVKPPRQFQPIMRGEADEFRTDEFGKVDAVVAALRDAGYLP